MSSSDVIILLPLIITALAAVLVMLVAAVKRSHYVSFIISLSGLIAAFISLFAVRDLTPRQVTPLIIIDNYALFYIGLITAATFIILLLSYSYFEKQEENKEEFYILILIAAFGSSVLVTATHFVSIFLGLEILSVSLYTLIAYLRKYALSIEAGIKYLILAAASSAFLLFGMALVYAELGTMEFNWIGFRLSNIGATPLVVTGFSMLIVGIGFKLAVVPFHMWTPDVYQGASSPVASFVATVSKGGMFALLFRFFIEINANEFQSVYLIFTVIAIASMLIGNLLALLQNNVKRILAYSSIAHLGYLLVAFIAGGAFAIEAATFYLTAYFITIIGSFGIIIILSTKEKEAEDINDFKGIFWRKPLIAAIFSAMLLSLAGIPLTAGFIGKYLVLSAGVNSTLWLLSVVLVVSSVIGLYYYLRIITVMYSKPEEVEITAKRSPSFSVGGGVALAGLTILLIWFGVYPTGIIEIIKTLVSEIIL